MTAPMLKRGWCPGVLKPMASGDGLLARIRPRRGRFSRSEALLISECAARCGNGAIDLSARGNIQLRGVSEASLPALTRALDDAGLLDESEAVEAARNIVISPASDCDPSALVDAAALAGLIEPIIAGIASKNGVASKFSLLIDDGGTFALDAVLADIRLRAIWQNGRPRLSLALAGNAVTARSLGIFDMDDALAHVGSLYQAAARLFPGQRPKGHDDVEGWAAEAGLSVCAAAAIPSAERGDGQARPRVDDASNIVSLRPAFGRLDALQLAEAAQGLSPEGHASFRPTTMRELLVAPVSADEKRRLDAVALREGFMIGGDDPLSRVSACVGAPACRNATTDVRGDARRLAATLPSRFSAESIHVSGCAKGCAKPSDAGVTLTGEAGLYRLGFGCRAGEGKSAGTVDHVIAQLAGLTDAPSIRS